MLQPCCWDSHAWQDDKLHGIGNHTNGTGDDINGTRHCLHGNGDHMNTTGDHVYQLDGHNLA